MDFKLHVAVDQEGLPLRTLVTPRNRYDSPVLPHLIQGLRPSIVVTDAGYDSNANRRAVKRVRAEPVTAVTSRSWPAVSKFKPVENDNVNGGRGYLYGQRSSDTGC